MFPQLLLSQYATIVEKKKAAMINFMRENPDLYKGRISDSTDQSGQKLKLLKQKLASVINGLCNENKTGDQILKSWSDWKRSVMKKKAEDIAWRSASGRGGSPSPIVFKPLDVALLNLIEEDAHGLKGIRQGGLPAVVDTETWDTSQGYLYKGASVVKPVAVGSQASTLFPRIARIPQYSPPSYATLYPNPQALQTPNLFSPVTHNQSQCFSQLNDYSQPMPFSLFKGSKQKKTPHPTVTKFYKEAFVRQSASLTPNHRQLQASQIPPSCTSTALDHSVVNIGSLNSSKQNIGILPSAINQGENFQRSFQVPVQTLTSPADDAIQNNSSHELYREHVQQIHSQQYFSPPPAMGPNKISPCLHSNSSKPLRDESSEVPEQIIGQFSASELLANTQGNHFESLVKVSVADPSNNIIIPNSSNIENDHMEGEELMMKHNDNSSEILADELDMNDAECNILNDAMIINKVRKRRAKLSVDEDNSFALELLEECKKIEKGELQCHGEPETNLLLQKNAKLKLARDTYEFGKDHDETQQGFHSKLLMHLAKIDKHSEVIAGAAKAWMSQSEGNL